VFSYLVAGMLAYGVIGWLVGRAVHAAVLLPVGMLVGLGISMAVIIYRSSRSWPAQSQGSEQPPDRPAARMRQGHAPRSRAMPRERS
jgi:F0F1-type ATP synthase assembly protein I